MVQGHFGVAQLRTVEVDFGARFQEVETHIVSNEGSTRYKQPPFPKIVEKVGARLCTKSKTCLSFLSTFPDVEYRLAYNEFADARQDTALGIYTDSEVRRIGECQIRCRDSRHHARYHRLEEGGKAHSEKEV